MTNPLAPIMDWYRISLDSMKVTERVVKRRIPGAIIKKHIFHNQTEPVCMKTIADARLEIEALVVLSLVATFERTLRDFITERPGRILAGGDPVDEAIRSEILKDIEYWKVSDRLIGIFGERIEGAHRGLIKQIVGYRNWVAHGKRSDAPPDGVIRPQSAFNDLSSFLVAAGIIDAI